ncbi:Cell division protein FtsK [Minicystis rosea]|nr:Cell division protein FtsK [Minicystis rosea]
MVLLASALFSALALASFRGDPLRPEVIGPDWVGPAGSMVAGAMAQAIGLAAWFFPIELALIAAPLLNGKQSIANVTRIAGDVVVVFILAALGEVAFPKATAFGGMPLGGLVGELFGEVLRTLFSTIGSYIIGLTIVALILVGRATFSFIEFVKRVERTFVLLGERGAFGLRALVSAWATAREIDKKRDEDARKVATPRIARPTADDAIIAALTEDEEADRKSMEIAVASGDGPPLPLLAAGLARAAVAAPEEPPADAIEAPVEAPAKGRRGAKKVATLAPAPTITTTPTMESGPRIVTPSSDVQPIVPKADEPKLVQGPRDAAIIAEVAPDEIATPSPIAPVARIARPLFDRARPAPKDEDRASKDDARIVLPKGEERTAKDDARIVLPKGEERAAKKGEERAAKDDARIVLPKGEERAAKDDVYVVPPNDEELASSDDEDEVEDLASYDDDDDAVSPVDEERPVKTLVRMAPQKSEVRAVKAESRVALPKSEARAPKAEARAPKARPPVEERAVVVERAQFVAYDDEVVDVPDDVDEFADVDESEVDYVDEPELDEPVRVAPPKAATPKPVKVATPKPAKVATPAPSKAATPKPAKAATPVPSKAEATPLPLTIVDTSAAQKTVKAAPVKVVPAIGEGFRLPQLDMLEPPSGDVEPIDEEQLKAMALLLEKTLADYGVSGKVEEIHPGPTVTTFEVSPAAGTKVSKVAGLADDLALGLSRKVRIIAPIPGKNRIGFEIPNERRLPVNLRELVEDRRFQEMKAPLPCVLGRDIIGTPYFADLASMPHVIVAGATGAGKSVGLNVMLVSLLYRRSPAELKMLMIDPKVVELAPFDRIPHMLLPVVTDMKQAANALKWAVDEMERRYQLFANAGTKNITTYNGWVEKVQRGEARPPKPTKVAAVGFDGNEVEVDAAKDGSDVQLPEKIPYIVIVVDEFADLMMQQGKDVEASVARLAQKARAAGMHVILATQRPSVDVITGMIKANFPTRIAFRVAQKVDSRTILDEQGAEHLLGRGDMLVKMNGTNDTRRVQCPFASEEEVQKVTDFLRLQGEPVYDENILKPRDEDGEVQEDEDAETDPMYDAAVRIVADTRRCSTSWIQRKLGVGYNRAAKIVEAMEKRGVVGPANGSKDREVLIGSL